MRNKFAAITIGLSAGGIQVLSRMLPVLQEAKSPPVFVVLHMDPNSDDFLVEYLNKLSEVKVKFGYDKEPVNRGKVYLAPPNYHMLVNENYNIALDVGEKVNFSRPAIDVTFQAVADAYAPDVLAIICTGANSDGSEGMKYVKSLGGSTIVQNTDEAEVKEMPKSAIAIAKPDEVLKLNEICKCMSEITCV